MLQHVSFFFFFSAESNLVVPDDDEFYKKFLRPCKWYPKSSFELVSKVFFFFFFSNINATDVVKIVSISQMKKFYKFKLNNPRFCLDLVPSNEQKVLRSDIAIPLPDRTADGCRMILINAGKQWNPKIISGDEILRTTMLLIEMAIFEPKTQVRWRKFSKRGEIDFQYFLYNVFRSKMRAKDEVSRI